MKSTTRNADIAVFPIPGDWTSSTWSPVGDDPPPEIVEHECLEIDEQQRISTAVDTIVMNRAQIDQANGMLMFVYGVDVDKAFELRQWQSQLHNVKDRRLARQLSTELVELVKGRDHVPRLEADVLLLTVSSHTADAVASEPGGETTKGH